MVNKISLLVAGIALILCLASIAMEKDSCKDATQALLNACKEGDVNAAEEALKNNANVHARDQDQYSPIIYAAERQSTPLLELLFTHGASVNAGINTNVTPLYWAVYHNNLNLAQWLLEHGAQVNWNLLPVAKSNEMKFLLYRFGRWHMRCITTPLASLVRDGNKDAVSARIKSDTLGPLEKEEGLINAVSIGHYATEMMITNVSFKDYISEAFYLCAATGDHKLFVFIYNTGNITLEALQKALTISAVHGYIKLVEFLLNQDTNCSLDLSTLQRHLTGALTDKLLCESKRDSYSQVSSLLTNVQTERNERPRKQIENTRLKNFLENLPANTPLLSFSHLLALNRK